MAGNSSLLTRRLEEAQVKRPGSFTWKCDSIRDSQREGSRSTYTESRVSWRRTSTSRSYKENWIVSRNSTSNFVFQIIRLLFYHLKSIYTVHCLICLNELSFSPSDRRKYISSFHILQLVSTKVKRQGNFITVAYSLRTY